MGRWVPDAQGRLIAAAMDLYSERGFEQTTVAEIAERAGLTERTFFRYFTDKREVLFFGSAHLETAMVEALEHAPADLSPIEAVALAIETAGTFFGDRRPHSKRRQAVIDANPELQERERNKMASIGSALAQTLERRGLQARTASLVAEMGIALFRIAFEQWLADSKERAFSDHVRDALAELKSLSA